LARKGQLRRESARQGSKEVSSHNDQAMAGPMHDALWQTTIFRRLSAGDRQRLAAVAVVRAYDKGALLFSEGTRPISSTRS
jgi:hypothetical protein